MTAILCAAAGLFRLLNALGVILRHLEQHRGPWLVPGLDAVAALLVIAAAIVLWMRRRGGVLLFAAGGFLSPLAHQLAGRPVDRPSLLLVAVALLIAANVRQLH